LTISYLTPRTEINSNLLPKISCSQIKWADADGDEVFNEEFDQDEDEENMKSTAKKKPAAVKPKSTKKLKEAVAKEKNNGSLLSFFQSPSQKRTATATAALDVEVTSSFMVTRGLKFCTAF
jgi:hypothetical protein